MARNIVRFGWIVALGMATATGCKPEPVTPTAPATRAASTSTTQLPDNAATQPTPSPATQPTTGASEAPTTSAQGDPNPLFTLPPSRGPAAHQFKQVTLLRDGPSGDLEMQLTGDGIYRIRDHGRGQSYAGNGKLEESQIVEWAALMKDWETLKDSYIADSALKGADRVQIIYGGKKVLFNIPGKDNPAVVTEVYQRLLALNEQSKKETGVSEAPAATSAERGK